MPPRYLVIVLSLHRNRTNPNRCRQKILYSAALFRCIKIYWLLHQTIKLWKKSRSLLTRTGMNNNAVVPLLQFFSKN